MLVCLIFCKPLLRLVFGAVEEDVMNGAVRYFLITVIAYPFLALFDVGAAFYRAGGNFRFPMMISVISNTMNIAGNAILIFGLGMGVAGAALSILFSRIFATGIVLFSLRKPQQIIVLRNYYKIRPDMPLIAKILSIGIPAGVENGMFQFGKLAIQSTGFNPWNTGNRSAGIDDHAGKCKWNRKYGRWNQFDDRCWSDVWCRKKGRSKILYCKTNLVWQRLVSFFHACCTFQLVDQSCILPEWRRKACVLCYEMLVAITIAKPLLWALDLYRHMGFRQQEM